METKRVLLEEMHTPWVLERFASGHEEVRLLLFARVCPRSDCLLRLERF